MSSNRKRKLPSVQRIPKDQPKDEEISVAVAEEPSQEPEVPTPITEVKFASIDVPLGEVAPGAYIPRFERTEFRSMSLVQARTLRRLTRGLQDAGETLANGTRVERSGHAIRWLLEKLDQPD